METGQDPKQKQDHEAMDTPPLGEAEKGVLLRIAPRNADRVPDVGQHPGVQP